MYGKRSGALPGLIIMSKEKLNLLKECKAWKQQVVHEVSMLGRSNMFKPEVARQCFYAGSLGFGGAHLLEAIGILTANLHPLPSWTCETP